MNLKEASSSPNHGHRKSQQLALSPDACGKLAIPMLFLCQEPDIIEVTSWKDETRQMYFNSIQQDRPKFEGGTRRFSAAMTFMTSQLGIHHVPSTSSRQPGRPPRRCRWTPHEASSTLLCLPLCSACNLYGCSGWHGALVVKQSGSG